MSGPIEPSPRRAEWIAMAGACAVFTAFAITGIVSEPPLGRIQGRVLDSYLEPVPNARVWLTPAREDGPTYRGRARTRPDGTFVLNAVPAGSYILSASSKAHGLRGPEVDVEEARVTPVALRLERSFEPLTCTVPTRTYLPSERVRISVTGYRIRQDASDPPITVVVSRLDVEGLLTVADGLQHYRSVFASWSQPAQIPPALARVSTAVSEHRPDVSRTDIEGHFDRRIDLGSLPPGAYIAAASYGDKTAYTPFTVTGIGLVVKKSGTQAYAYAADLRTGQPLEGVRVRMFRQAGYAGGGSTGPDGLTELRLSHAPTDGDDGWAGVLAAHGRNYAWAFGYDSGNFDAPYRLHVYTDRPIYRPGQEVRFKGILRGMGRSPGAYAVPENVPVRVRVEDPEGVLLDETEKRTNAFGSFSGAFELSSETPSGSATIFVEVGPLREAYSFTVASYRKPEFTIEARPRRAAYVAGETIEVDVSARYYYGAPVEGASVACAVIWDTLWEWEPNATDEDEERPWFSGTSEFGSLANMASAVLDADGQCVLRIPTGALADASDARGLTATFSISVKDPAGRMADASASARLYPGSIRLFVTPMGYVCAPNQPARFQIRAYDLASRPVPSLSVQLESYRDSLVVQRPHHTKAPRSQSIARVSGITDASGTVTLAFTPTQPGELRVVATARDTEGRRVTVTDYVWCVSGSGSDLETDYADLAVHTDKRSYTVGETARILINSERTGSSVVVTVEGDRIYRTEVVPLDNPSTVIAIPILEAYGPNVWVSVSGIWRKKFASTSAQLKVSVPSRQLRVIVTPDSSEHKPKDTVRFRISVTDTRGLPVLAEASFALVDESIYALQEDNPSAVMEAFYPRVYSRVSTMHSCEEYLYSGDKAQPVIEARRKFLDAPYWHAHVVTDAGGQAEIMTRLPDNLTAWRATAIVHTKQSQFGWTTAKVISSLPFHVRLDTPRFLTETDQATFIATITNATARKRRTTVSLSGSGIQVIGDASRGVDVPSAGSAVTSWIVRADRPGTAKVSAAAWSSDTPHLADAVELSIPVRPRAREVTLIFAGHLGQRSSESHAFDAPDDPLPAALTLRVTPSALSAIPSAVDYLLTYPYGCTEQTISGFLPNLLVARLLARLPQSTSQALRDALGPNVDERVRRSVRDGISRLARLQRYDGSIGWFENDPGDPWLTAYALLALGEARRDGYLVSNRMIEETTEAATRLLNDAGQDERAFLVLALASLGVKAVHRLDVEKLRPAGLACAALAMRTLGILGPELQRADEALLRSALGSGELAWWRNAARPWGSEWTELLTTSLAVRAVLARDPADPIADKALRHMMLSRTDSHWTSTRDTAFVLMALCDYAALRPEAAWLPGGLRLKVNDRIVDAVAVQPNDMLARELVRRLPGVALRAGANRIAVDADGEARPYYSVAVRTSTRGGLNRTATSVPGAWVTRTYEHVRTASLPLRGSVHVFEKLTGAVRSGAVLRCRIVIQTPRELPFVMVTDPIPAGAEPSARGDVAAEWSEWYSATDVRDDRVVFFARRVPAGKHVIEYFLRAQTPGSFSALPTRLECMYDPSIRVETSATQLQIR